jgi:protein-disulfide isomerase
MQRRSLLRTAGLATGTAAFGGLAGVSGIVGRQPVGLIGSAAASDAWPPAVGEYDMVLGDDDAPVTMIEYASFTCGHCANFHTESLPTIKEDYIDQGHVRLIFRDFPLDGLALRAGLIARAAPKSRYFSVVDVMFQQQSRWVQASDPIAALSNIALMAGASQEDIDANLQNEPLADALITLRTEGESRYQVSATPTFVIEGEVISGNMPLADMQSTLDSHI